MSANPSGQKSPHREAGFSLFNNAFKEQIQETLIRWGQLGKFRTSAHCSQTPARNNLTEGENDRMNEPRVHHSMG